MDLTDATTRPAANELEVSLFGPGYGECVVLHVGNNEWIVVDSCTQGRNHASIATEYLEQIGADISSAVRLIVATHWHDDHIKGLAGLLQRASTAKLVCSAAMGSEEFLTMVKLAEGRPFEERSGIREMRTALQLLTDSRRDGPMVAMENRLLWRRPSSAQAELWSLSPSDASFRRAQEALAALIPRPGSPEGPFPNVRPNHASVALWLSVGERRILLGSDLEEKMVKGWSTIAQSEERPPGLCGAYKVAHHGSITGHHDSKWTVLLAKGTKAILTPYLRGNKRLPTDKDLRRIALRASAVHISASLKPTRSRARRGAVGKQIAETARAFRDAQGRMGHIRMRAKADGSDEWRTDLFGAAWRYELSQAS